MQDYGKSIASKGCLLITRYNGNPDLVGVMGLLRSPDPVVHPDKLIRVEIDLPCINNEWVEIAFNTGITRHLLRQRVRTTAGQAGISGLDVKQMPIPVPPIREQQRIVAKVQRRFSVLDQVEATVNACLSRCGQFKQVALKRVFEG
jgi:type I restriction enzyme S subunit